MVLILSIVAATIQSFSIIQYVYYLLRNHLILNKATWFVSALVMVLSASSYFSVVRHGNAVIATSTIITATSFVFIFLYSLLKGKFASFSKSDLAFLFFAAATIVAWKLTGDARIANLILQAVIFISFIPTIVGLVQGRLKERPIPWFLSAIASMFVAGAVFLTYGFSDLVALSYPLIIGVFLNTIIAVLALLTKKATL